MMGVARQKVSLSPHLSINLQILQNCTYTVSLPIQVSAFLYVSVFSLSSRSLYSSFPSAFSLPIIPFSTLHLSPLTPLQPVLQLQVSKSQPEGVGSVGWLIQLPVDISAALTSPLSPLCSPAPSRPPGHMSSHCLLSIRPNYSVGFPRHSHTPILTDLTQV